MPILTRQKLLDSLQEYVLVNHKRQRVDYFQHNPQGLWTLQSFYLGDTVTFASINCEVAVVDIYEDVELG